MGEPQTSSKSTVIADRSFWQVWGVALLIIAVGLVVAWQFVGAPPPERLLLATGVVDGGYDESGQSLRTALADSGIHLELRRTAGSVENLALLRAGKVDLAYVQGGVAESLDGLQSVASLYFEPLWIFVSRGLEIGDLGDLKGQRIQAGAPGSGTRAVALELLGANGVDEHNATLLVDGPDAAATSLLNGGCDALLVVTSPRAQLVHRLFAAAAARPFSLDRAVAYSRHYPYLEALTLTPGMVDLRADLPAAAVELVAPSACLVARPDLHPAVIPLLIEGARQQHGGRGLFEDEAEFPGTRSLEFPLAEAAERHFRSGPSFLYRVLPFQVAALLDRLKILLLPLLTLLFPLFKLAPPLYRWRMRSKIVRWYRVLLNLEAEVRAEPSAANRARCSEQLDLLDSEIAGVKVPLSFAEELYNVRMHLRLVKRVIAGDGPRT